jgi:GNAT superfamily N-acetyltransferase
MVIITEFDHEHVSEIFAIEKELFPVDIHAESGEVYKQYKGWVAKEKNQVVGFCLYARGDIWMLATIGVLPAYQGMGLARKMLNALCKRADACGASMQLRAWQGQCHLVRLYQRAGFMLLHGTENAHGSPMMVRLGRLLV